MPVLRLADRRLLAVSDLGTPDGFPVVYCHGAIGSPLGADAELTAALARLRVRLLAVQRPGFGASDPQPGRTVRDFAADVEELAGALGLGRFAVIGVSAGGPYAVACAHRLGDRVTAAAVSSLAPGCAGFPGLPARVRLPLRAVAAAPGLTALAGDAALAVLSRHPGLLRFALGRGGVDRGDCSAAAAAGALLAATAGGVRGLVDDHRITTAPWGFDLRDVAGEVHVWHGMHDPFVPVEHALQMTAELPRCRVWLDPGEGHFFFRRRVGEILGALVSASRGRARPRSPSGTARFARPGTRTGSA